MTDKQEQAIEVIKEYRNNLQLDGDIKAFDAVSRRAAVSRISDLLMLELHGERIPTWNEVYNALNDLPSVTPKLTDDAVSREAAIKALLEHEDAKGYLHGDFEEIIKELPSVTVRQTGEWIPVSDRLPTSRETENMIANY